jgi:hypothetical protein
MTTLDSHALEYIKLMNSNEELHEDLLPYVEEGEFGQMLRHPLVYEVPWIFSKGMANRRYEEKIKMVEKAIDSKNWKQYVWLHERPYRLEAFAQIENLLNDVEYWNLLGSIWTDTENGWANLKQWKKFFKSKRTSRNYLMDSEELKILDNLPKSVTIYRGCQKDVNENGISWTLDKDRAEWFATRFKQEGLVLEKTILKRDIIAVFTGRSESEVVIL